MLEDPSIAFIALVAAVSGLLAIKYWKQALFGVFVLMIFEGALRKWVFPSAQAQIYLLKDLILVAVYIGFALDKRRRDLKIAPVSMIKLIFFMGLIYGIFEVANPHSPSLLVGLVGLKAYFLYVPVAFILPYTFENSENLYSMIRWYLAIAIPVALLGFLQLAAGPDSFLSTYVGSTEDATILATFGKENELVRTSGTFSYISGYSAYLSFLSFLALGYNFATGWRLRANILPIVSLALIIGAMFTTGSRTPVYVLLASLPIVLCLAASSGVLNAKMAVRLLFLVPVIGIASLNISSGAFEAFLGRATDAGSDSTMDRIMQPFEETLGAIWNAPIFGMGIGVTHPAAMSIMDTKWPWWLGDLLTEVETARITVELGVIGLLLTCVLRILSVTFALRSAMAFRKPADRGLGIVLAVHLLIGMTGSVMLNPTTGLYFWGALGLILTMRRLERLEVASVAKGRVRNAPAASQAFAA